MAEPVHLTDATFDEYIKTHPYVVVDFWASWCMPCRAVEPVVKDLANKYEGKVAFAKVNADENPEKMKEFGIMGIPTILFFKEGELVDTVVGAVPKVQLDARVLKHF